MLLESQKMAANIQFEKWTADQVAEWLRGLDMENAMITYMHYFLSSGVDGKKLLLMTHADLDKLSVLKLGHQELILEAIDLLRNLRYGYETENMQSLALQLGCKARSLNGEMRARSGENVRSLNGEMKARSGENDRNRANVSHTGDSQTKRLSIGILLTVADLLVTLKSLVSWMDKAPFIGLHGLCLVRNTIVKLGLDLIFMCQREASLKDVDNNITTLTNTLSNICEKLVIGSQDSPLDPLYLQPASLEQATIRKKQGEELGMHIQSIYYGVHVISEVKDMSPADLCGKIEQGDEVIQVNHQIVAGWSLKKLVNLLKENPKEIVLLLKKRPRHISPFGHMINKKKQAMMNKHVVQSSTLPKSMKKMRSRDGETMLRPMQEFVNSVSSIEKTDDIDSPKETLDGNDTDNDVFRSGSESPQFTQYSLSIQVDPKQRRATVSGGSPTLSHPLLVIEDIDVPVRPKSFVITSTRSNMPREIIINSPSGDNLSDFLKKTSELKMKSSPLSQELSVPANSTPQIIESHDEPATKSDNLVQRPEIHLDIDNAVTVTSEKALIANTDESNAITLHSDVDKRSQNTSSDNSANSIESTKGSMESQQSGLSHDISSHSLNMGEKSNHIDKEISHFVLAQPAVQTPNNMEAYIHQRTPPARVVQHYEVASDFDKNQPRLMKITKIDSLMRNRKPDVDKKNKHVDFQAVDSDKEASKDEQCSYVCKVVGGVPQKIPVEPKGSHVQISSPVQRRNKPVRKKVDRRVSCKDLGKGDCEGWLFKRKARPVIMSSNWQKCWCVIKDCNLFCYHDMEALKAKLVINLPVFKVSPVEESEVKTKKFPFKVHNNGATFMFASERKEDMTKWMNKMCLAAITYCEYAHHTKHNPNRSRGTPDPDFSESETEEEVPDEPEGGGQSRDASPDINSSQVDLPQLYRKQSRRGKNIFGEDLHKKRKNTLRGTREPMSPETIRLSKLTTLQRTLKAKCKELEEIDRMLSLNSRDKLRDLKQYLKSVDLA